MRKIVFDPVSLKILEPVVAINGVLFVVDEEVSSVVGVENFGVICVVWVVVNVVVVVVVVAVELGVGEVWIP